MKDSKLALILGGLLLLSREAIAFTASLSPATGVHRWTGQAMPKSLLHMQPNYDPTEDSAFSPTTFRQRRDQQQQLRAISIDAGFEENLLDDGAVSRAISFSDSRALPTDSSFLDSGLWQVLSAAALVTGNTVGAGMLVLPGLAAGPGLAISSALFLGIYLAVLTSGLVIADVAINQHESGYHVPSSFQEFAEANLDNQRLAKGISAIPVAVNSLVMVFAFSKAGELGSSLLSSFMKVDPAVASVGFVGVIAACLSTLSGENLSAVASLCVSALLVAFGGLLLPGLATVQDPLGTLMTPGLAGEDWLASVVVAAPIVLTALQFQNVVPSLTKILKYDRTKTVFSIALGSFTPLAMYLAWCFAVLGDGIDTSAVSSAGPLISIFTAATLFGSSIGASMSVVEEVEMFMAPKQEEEDAGDVFCLPAVLLSLVVPLVGVFALSGGNDASAALIIAGSFGAPVLYGIVPAVMVMTQRRKAEANNNDINPLVPNSLAGCLGLVATAFVGEGLVHQASCILSAAAA